MRAAVLAFKKELILQKVSELLENEGFMNLTMQQIARHCNISVGALYKLFASKEDLFYAYVHYQIDLFLKTIENEFTSISNPKERIRRFIELKFELFKEKRRLLLDTIAGDPLFFAKLNANKDNPAKKIYERVAKELEHIGFQKPLKLSYALNGLTLGYLEFWLAEKGELDAQEVYELFLKMVKENR